jgi:hypothetical protein
VFEPNVALQVDEEVIELVCGIIVRDPQVESEHEAQTCVVERSDSQTYLQGDPKDWIKQVKESLEEPDVRAPIVDNGG